MLLAALVLFTKHALSSVISYWHLYQLPLLAFFIHSRLPSKQLQGSESASLRLQFQNRLAQPLYTGRRVEGENANSIQVFLQDANTGSIVIIEDESAVRLDIVVLEGDFSNDDKEDWSSEEFENYVVKEREGKRPLLTGDLSIQLKQGIATLGELVFTDNSSWIRSRKFRLGVKIASGCLNGSRVREAKTEPFFVKDHRGQCKESVYTAVEMIQFYIKCLICCVVHICCNRIKFLMFLSCSRSHGSIKFNLAIGYVHQTMSFTLFAKQI